MFHFFSRGFSSAPILNRFSRRLTSPKSQGAAQSMLYAIGFRDSDFSKGQVGIASMWFDGNPCNAHLLDFATKIRSEVNKTDGIIGLRFNTIGISDGMSMGTSGMSYSLPSRDLIADSIESVMKGQWYDGLIAVAGCDKNMPGAVMGMCRVNRPSLMMYGGTIDAGRSCKQPNRSLDIVSSFESYGKYLSGQISEAERMDIVRNACPGPGACGGMYTANTMASAIETLGLSLPFSSSIPARDKGKMAETEEIAKAIKHLLEIDLKPLDILSRRSFENAITIVNALGGSTNAVLHLIAMARSANIELDLNDFQRISDRTPLLADMKPSGRYLMADLNSIGGIPAVQKYLMKMGLIDGDCLTVTGKTLKENLKNVPDIQFNSSGSVEKGDGPGGQSLLKSVERPIAKLGNIKILFGNLAPRGAVAKITGKEGESFTGLAAVYDSEEEMLASLERGELKKGERRVIVIRYEGPKSGPGMPEMLSPTSAVMGAGLGNDVALITDGRFSGGSHGFIVGHITPEAADGGPIALIENGDEIAISATTRQLNIHVDAAELAKRKARWESRKAAGLLKKLPESGYLRKYAKSVQSALEGCITDA